MADFTRGNWSAAAKPSSIVGWPVVSTPEGKCIANVHFPRDKDPEGMAEAKANSHLIAAAPELYEALGALANLVGWYSEDAVGCQFCGRSGRNLENIFHEPDCVMISVMAALRNAEGKE